MSRPHKRHNGEDRAILEQRKRVYTEAWKRPPLRWSAGIRNWKHEPLVKLNPVNEEPHNNVMKNAA